MYSLHAEPERRDFEGGTDVMFVVTMSVWEMIGFAIMGICIVLVLVLLIMDRAFLVIERIKTVWKERKKRK